MLPLSRLLQIQNDFDHKRVIQTGRQQPLEARVGERHAASGREIVTFPNGGKAIAGVRTFDASIPVGTRVMASQAPGSQAISLSYKNAPNIAVPETEDTAYPIKILFYGTIDGVTGFYVGGDRPIPKKIDIPPEYNKPRAANYNRGRWHGFTNSGRGLNNWIAAFIKNNESPVIEGKLPTTYMVDGLGNVYENTPEIYIGGVIVTGIRQGSTYNRSRFYLAYSYGNASVDGQSVMKCYYQDFYFWSSTFRHFIDYFSTPYSGFTGGNYTSTVSTFKDSFKGSAFTLGYNGAGHLWFYPEGWNVVESFIKPDFALQSGVTLGENLGHWNSLLNGKENKTAIAVKSSYHNQNVTVPNLTQISPVSIDDGRYQLFFVASDNSLVPIDKDVIFNFGFQAALGTTTFSDQLNLKLPTSQEWAGYDVRTHLGTLVGNVLYKPIVSNLKDSQFEKDGILKIKGYDFIRKVYLETSANFYKIPPRSIIQKIAYHGKFFPI
jgi:hypothetical protein